jgi:urease accessory protein
VSPLRHHRSAARPLPHGDHHDTGHDNRHDHPATGGPADRPVRIGIGGPVGSGKTTLVAALCALLRDELSLVVVTNDIFTTEDAEALRRADVLPHDRIVAVETGCCPHTAIRDDIAANLDAAEELEARVAAGWGPVELTLIESGGDNLTAIFSRGLVDAQIFVIDTAGGDDVPRKGGPGVATADLLVINKTDLARYVGADLELMLSDAAARRAGAPVLPTSLVDAAGATGVADWVRGVVGAWQQERSPSGPRVRSGPA